MGTSPSGSGSRKNAAGNTDRTRVVECRIQAKTQGFARHVLANQDTNDNDVYV